MTTLTAMMSLIEIPIGTSCWEWNGNVNRAGYGRVRHNGNSRQAHRTFWLLAGREIAPHLVLDHLCRNRRCVNPDHLAVETRGGNVLKGLTIPARNAAKTHCAHGHEFTPDNTYVWQNIRQCVTCRARVEKNRGRR